MQRILLVLAPFAALLAPASMAAAEDHALSIDDAELISSFGGRTAISPDGRKIAFIGRTYDDAFELDLATRRLRNLTAGFPHQGIMRIQYLPGGDFLVTAPRRHSGPNTRAQLEMWFLDKTLTKGLQPLGERVFEGIAVSKSRNLVSWTTIEPALKPTDSWQMAFIRPTKRYVAEITFQKGAPRIVNKREILATLPEQCTFIEPQDFRDDDREVVYSCMGAIARGDFTIAVMGTNIATGQTRTYINERGGYNEVEGIAPDGSWAAVECGKQDKPGLPPLDICRLELDGSGKMSLLVRGRIPGTTIDISNPVISPDGKWVIFQRSDGGTGEIGEGYGIYRLRLPSLSAARK